MTPILVEPGAAWFRAATGARSTSTAPRTTTTTSSAAAPVVGLVVDDFDATRQAMVAAGIAFIGEPQRDGGSAWNHYRGPDGNVYEIMGRDREAAMSAASPTAGPTAGTDRRRRRSMPRLRSVGLLGRRAGRLGPADAGVGRRHLHHRAADPARRPRRSS